MNHDPQSLEQKRCPSSEGAGRGGESIENGVQLHRPKVAIGTANNAAAPAPTNSHPDLYTAAGCVNTSSCPAAPNPANHLEPVAGSGGTLPAISLDTPTVPPKTAADAPGATQASAAFTAPTTVFFNPPAGGSAGSLPGPPALSANNSPPVVEAGRSRITAPSVGRAAAAVENASRPRLLFTPYRMVLV